MSKDALTRASKMAGLVVLLFTLLGASYAGSRIVLRDLLGFETREQHNTDINRVERKLDCALFNLPTDCRDTLSPRSP